MTRVVGARRGCGLRAMRTRWRLWVPPGRAGGGGEPEARPSWRLVPGRAPRPGTCPGACSSPHSLCRAAPATSRFTAVRAAPRPPRPTRAPVQGRPGLPGAGHDCYGSACSTAKKTAARRPGSPLGRPGRAYPASAPARRRSRLLADISPLREHADFRRLWFGNTVSYIGQQMTAMAVALQVYAITGSSFYVGLVGLCSLVPLIVFGLYGGAVADVVDRRRLGLVTASGATVLSAALAVVAIAHVRHVWPLYAIVALQAVCFAMNSPARSSMIPAPPAAPRSCPPPTRWPRWPAASGRWPGPCSAASSSASGATRRPTSSTWPPSPPRSTRCGGCRRCCRATGPSGAGAAAAAARRRPSVLEGLRYLAARPNLRTTFVTDLCAMVLAQPRVLFPAVAGLWFGGDTSTVGLLAAAPGRGGAARQRLLRLARPGEPAGARRAGRHRLLGRRRRRLRAHPQPLARAALPGPGGLRRHRLHGLPQHHGPVRGPRRHARPPPGRLPRRRGRRPAARRLPGRLRGRPVLARPPPSSAAASPVSPRSP